MAKIYQQVEQIFKFRILSNEEIPAYLARMSRMGKIDEIAKHEMLALILKRLGEIEDFEDVPNYPYPVEVTAPPSTYTLADLGVEIGGASRGSEGSDGSAGDGEEIKVEAVGTGETTDPVNVGAGFIPLAKDAEEAGEIPGSIYYKGIPISEEDRKQAIKEKRIAAMAKAREARAAKKTLK